MTPTKNIFIFLALLLCTIAAHAQRFATNKSLEIVTWNLEWFGYDHPSEDKGPTDEVLQLQNAAKILDSLGKIDVIVMQEICSRSMFEQLSSTSGYSSYLSPGADTYQKIGILYSPSLEVIANPRIILYAERQQFGQRPPVFAKFKHPTVGEFCVIGLHFKAHILSATQAEKQDSYDRRKRATELLKQFVTDSLGTERVVILGDWNDDVDVSNFDKKETPLKPLLDAEDFRYVTKYLSYTFNESSKYGSIIDHICISNELFTHYRGSGIVSAPEIIPSYISTTSDHFPVFSVFE